MNPVLALAIPLFILMDFIGTIPVFISLTQGAGQGKRIRIAIFASLLAGAIVLVFALGGNFILSYFSISVEAMKVGGGLLLLYIAFEMILAGQSAYKEADTKRGVVVSPLAIPMLAGPGSMSFALLAFLGATGLQKVNIILAIAITSIAGAVVLSLSTAIHKFCGEEFTRGLEKVTAVIISFIAVEMIMSGIRAYFSLG